MNDDLKSLQDKLTRIKEIAADLKQSVANEWEERRKEKDLVEEGPFLEDQEEKLARVQVKFNGRNVIDQYFPRDALVKNIIKSVCFDLDLSGGHQEYAFGMFDDDDDDDQPLNPVESDQPLSA